MVAINLKSLSDVNHNLQCDVGDNLRSQFSSNKEFLNVLVESIRSIKCGINQYHF